MPADRADTSLTALGLAPGVRYAERGAVVQADSDYVNTGFSAMEIPQAWTWTTGSPAVTVAVVDTGVSPTADLGEDRLVPGYDVLDGDTDAADGNGHGTLVAGVLAADPSNGTGISGVCGLCRVMPVRVLTGREGTSADVAAGIAWAAEHGAQVINVSLSTASPSRLLQDAVEHASARDVLVVASAGNVASTARRYPAAFESTLAVSQVGAAQKNTATDQWVDVSAYGNFAAVNPAGSRTQLIGASGSTAAVAGVAALAVAMRPSASAQEIRTAIERDAVFSPVLPAYQAPLINAAQVVYNFGGTDTTAPTVSRTGLTENEPVGISGETMVPQSTDDHGVEHLEVIVDGKVTQVISRPGGQVTLRPPAGFNGPLPVTVIAYDYAGNSGRATTVIQADTIKPTGTLLSPAPNAVVHGATVDVTITSPDTDLAYVLPALQADACGCTSLTRVPGTNQWTGKTGVETSGQVGVALQDEAGNRTLLFRTVRIDNEPPAGGTIGPASGKRVRGTFTSTLTGLSDLGGVAKTELWANGKYVGVDRSAPYALAVKTGSYSGKLTLTWKATDRWGQSRTLPVRTLTADNAGPAVSITRAPKHKAKVKGTVKVHVKASDAAGVGRVELLINGKVVAKDTTSGYALTVNTSKRKKTMKVQIRAYDRVGNVKYTGTRTWYRR
ncbi:S8 family serine peptidase [Actinoplanes sp. NPDC049599]|uniref:S8 family serine peptidase n=1 Tax=Actinoplanes sp. NPDC049599 TaxID=3363903 RepID=UPI0037B848FC